MLRILVHQGKELITARGVGSRVQSTLVTCLPQTVMNFISVSACKTQITVRWVQLVGSEAGMKSEHALLMQGMLHETLSMGACSYDSLRAC